MMDYILTGEADAVNKAEKHMWEFVSENKEKNTVSFRFPFAFKTASKWNTLIFEINRDDMIFISDLFE